MTRRSVDPVGEVLLDFQSVMAEFLELQTEVMSALAQRRARVRAAPSAPAPVPNPVLASAPPASESAPERAGFFRYTLAVRECRSDTGRATIASDRTIVVTDDGRGVARLVAERLRRDGRKVATITARATSDAQQQELFVSPLDSTEEADRIAHRIVDSCGPVGALIHLAPLSAAPGFDGLDAASWRDRLSCETRTLFLLARRLSSSLEQAARDGGAALIAVTSMGGAFGVRSVDCSMLPSQGGVVGFTKCLAIEWPAVRVRAVDLDLGEPTDALAAHVIDELWSPDPSPEIGYCGGTRVSVDLVRSPVALDPGFVVPSDAVILATGGARGISAEVCLELAERYQPTFVLVGQSPLPAPAEPPDVAMLEAPVDIKRALAVRLGAGSARVTPGMVERAYGQLLKEREIRETIGRLGAAGARTHYVQLDVRDADAFGALIDHVYAAYGRLDGVIHGAGLIEDKLVRDKSLESFDRVFRTKAISAFVLSRHLRPESLRFAVFFSSVAGRFGNRGQADYAAANEVVSKLAVALQGRWPARVCSIAWAPWDGVGMVSPELTREFARRGVDLLSPNDGRRALWQEIQQGPAAAAEVVVAGRLAAASAPEHETLPLLRHAARESAPAGAVRFVRHLDPSVDHYLRDHRLDGRPVLPLAFATEIIAEAAQAAFPDLRVVAVRDLQLFKGIVIDAAASVPLVVTARSAVHSHDNGLTEVDVDISTPSTNPAVRYRAVVQLATREMEPPAYEVPPSSLAPLSKPLDVAYRDWTFHGPLFQRLTRVEGIGLDSIVGTVYSSSSIPVLSDVARPEWILDPFVFDAALQLLLMWSRARNDKTLLPSRFRSFTRYRPLSDRALTCHIAVESLAAGHALKMTAHLVDGDRRVAAVIDTLETSGTSALNRLATAVTGDGRIQ